MAERPTKETLQRVLPPRKRLMVFVVCLLISTFLWFTRELQKDFSTSLAVPIEFVDLPEGLAIMGDIPDHVEVNVSSHGFSIFGQSILGRVKPLKVFLGQFDGPGLMTLNEAALAARLQESVSAEADILSFSPTQFSFTIESVANKTVPIRTVIEATFEEPFFLASAPYSIPDSVEVYGPASMINAITEIETEALVLHDLDESTELSAKLSLPNHIECEIQDIQAGIKLDQWTEKRFQVPITVPDWGSALEMRTYPQETEVVFQVGMSEYENTKPAQFIIEVDINDPSALVDQFEVGLRISAAPSHVRRVEVQPQKVEFILIGDQK